MIAWAAIAIGLIPVAALAQSASTGTITGRVLNAGTGDYLRNAVVTVVGTDISTIAEAGGNYRLLNVSAGEVKIKAEFTSLDPVEAMVNVTANQTVAHDFSLTSNAYDKDTIILDQFVVASAREGNAKAIMDQRNAENMKQVVASDSFGTVSEGNAGEFLKLMPGMSIDYVEADARAARIRGMDPKYTVVLMDGAPVASAGSSSLGTGRTFEFEQISIASIESVEITKTPTALDNASSVAGVINLRSKGAFDRKGRRIDYTASLAANQYYVTVKSTPGIDDENHYKLSPNVSAEFSDVFLGGKLGVMVGANFSNTLTAQKHMRISNSGQGAYTWNSVPDDNMSEVPTFTRFNFRDGPKWTRRNNYNMRLDFKVSPDFWVWGRVDFNRYYSRFELRDEDFIFTTLDTTQPRSLTTLTTTATGGSVAVSNSGNDKFGDTVTLTSAGTYTHGALTADVQTQYSRATNAYNDLSSGFFGGMGVSLSGIGLSMTRSAADSTDITVTQFSGANYRDLSNYSLNTISGTTTTLATLTNAERKTKDQRWTGKADFKYALNWPVSTQIRWGGAVNEAYRDIERWSNATKYLGPDGIAGTADDLRLTYPDYYEKDIHTEFGMGGNIDGLQQPSPYYMAKMYVAHPNWFQSNAGDNLQQYLFSAGGNVDIKEQVSALYFSPNFKVTSRFTIAPGIRWEATRVAGLGRNDKGLTITNRLMGLPDATVAPANTAPNYYTYILTRYGSRLYTSKSYDNSFLFLHTKYDLTNNSTVRASYNESISRPDMGNIVPGVTAVNDTTGRVTLANPDLKPETSKSINVSFEHYWKPASMVSATLFYSDLKNIQRTENDMPLPEELQASYPGYLTTQTQNVAKARRTGIELSYNQQFTFLPGALSGLGAFANYTHVRFDDWNAFLGSPSEMRNVGLTFKYKKFDARFNVNYTNKKLLAGSTVDAANGGVLKKPTNGIYQWERARVMCDLELSYQLNKTLGLFLTGRNLLNEPYYIYQNQVQYATRIAYFGTLYTMGVKGAF